MFRSILAVAALVLSGCMAPQITDFSDRGIYYAWVDVSEISGNRVTGATLRNMSAPRDERYYPAGAEKVGSGYLVWHYGARPGVYEFNALATMSCLGIMCSNTINEFMFSEGATSIGRANVARAGGVYFGGCYALKRTKRGFIRPGEFATRRAPCGATKAQMRDVLLTNADDPLLETRVRQGVR